MKEKDLPIDRSKHVIYTKNTKNCVRKLLRRYYDAQTAEQLWEKIQLQYCEYLKEEPALGSAKITVSIYDPILIFAWYAVVPDKPQMEEIQKDTKSCIRRKTMLYTKTPQERIDEYESQIEELRKAANKIKKEMKAV